MSWLIVTWLMTEDFKGEVPFELGKGLGFLIGNGRGIRGSNQGTAKWLQQRDDKQAPICTEDSEWFNLAKVLHIL